MSLHVKHSSKAQLFINGKLKNGCHVYMHPYDLACEPDKFPKSLAEAKKITVNEFKSVEVAVLVTTTKIQHRAILL